MVGRILLEYFKSAVESNSELNFDEVFNTVNQIISDPGKIFPSFFQFCNYFIIEILYIWVKIIININ